MGDPGTSTRRTVGSAGARASACAARRASSTPSRSSRSSIPWRACAHGPGRRRSAPARRCRCCAWSWNPARRRSACASPPPCVSSPRSTRTRAASPRCCSIRPSRGHPPQRQDRPRGAGTLGAYAPGGPRDLNCGRRLRHQAWAPRAPNRRSPMEFRQLGRSGLKVPVPASHRHLRWRGRVLQLGGRTDVAPGHAPGRHLPGEAGELLRHRRRATARRIRAHSRPGAEGTPRPRCWSRPGRRASPWATGPNDRAPRATTCARLRGQPAPPRHRLHRPVPSCTATTR